MPTDADEALGDLVHAREDAVGLAMNLLCRRRSIEGPVGNAKSVVPTEAGEGLAPEFLARHFAKARP